MTKTTRSIYIAGPMSGIENHNKESFMDAHEMLKGEGWENIFNPIMSPASRLVQEGKISGQEAYRQCMALDLKFICEEADAIYMLVGWEKSPGARAEHATATCLSLNIFYEV